ncbi:MAG: hypothetical protein V3R56_09870, partial [Xanthomonadales bacterium]
MKKTGITRQGAARQGAVRQARHSASLAVTIRPDSWVLIPALLLLSIGIVMVGSASIAIAESQGVGSYYYLWRHLIYVFLGVMLALSFRVIPV